MVSWQFFFIFAYIIHLVIHFLNNIYTLSYRWPYPFLDLSSPYAPAWYVTCYYYQLPSNVGNVCTVSYINNLEIINKPFVPVIGLYLQPIPSEFEISQKNTIFPISSWWIKIESTYWQYFRDFGILKQVYNDLQSGYKISLLHLFRLFR